VLRGDGMEDVELNEGGEDFQDGWWKQEEKTRIFFLWQWGWVQIRSCGRG